ncbi:TonB-dependent receptor [Thalassospira marina]|uniref:TonB-dependent receptor n=1 Tax=Thalassospira marina TaxID=2048283 RepID=A0A2N3KW84_9PROT|nr:TonB-dependent receptor [Thalassospira marina]PKR54746.1 TonB-dependent receptor [Thalassospira marina]
MGYMWGEGRAPVPGEMAPGRRSGLLSQKLAATALSGCLLVVMPHMVLAASTDVGTVPEAAIATVTATELAQAVSSDPSFRFDIPAQTLTSALVEYSRITGIDVVIDGDLSSNHVTPAFKGEMTANQALDSLLNGTGLTWQALDSHTVSIVTVHVDQSLSPVVTAPVTITSYAGRGVGVDADPETVYETPGGLSVVTRDDMQKVPGREARDIFGQVAGVDISNDARDPGLTVNVRGQQEMGRVNVNIDGARQNYNQTTHGTTSRVYVDPALLANVTIDKTNMNQSGGAGTSAGIVTLRTLNTDDILDFGEDWGGKVNLSHGTNNYNFAGDASVAARVSPKLDIAAAMSRKTIGNYRAGSRNPELFTLSSGKEYTTENSRPEYTFSRQTSGLLKANIQLTDDQELHLGYVGSMVDYAKTSDVTNLYTDFNETQTHTLTAKHNWNPDSELIDLNTNLYWTRTKNHQNRPARYNSSGRVTTDSFSTDYTLDTAGADIANSSDWYLGKLAGGSSSIRFNYGTEFFQDKAKTDSSTGGEGGSGEDYQLEGSTPGGKRDVYGGFLKTTYDWDEMFQVYGGLRYDRYQLDGNAYWCDTAHPCTSGGVPYDVNLSDQKVSPSFGASVTPFDGIQFFANYRKNMRAPTIAEAMIKGEHIGDVGIPFYANGNLQSEESETKEIGVNFKFDDVLQKHDRFRAKFTYYRTKIDNYVTLGYVPEPTTNVSCIPSPCTPSYIGRTITTNQAAAMVNLTDPVYINGSEFDLNYDADMYYLGGTLTLNDVDLKGNYNPFVLNTAYDEYANYQLDEVKPANLFNLTGPIYGNGGTLYGIYAPPKRKITLDGGLRLFDRNLILGMRATFVEPQDNFGSSNISTVVGKYFSYRIFDFYSSYKINDHVAVRLAVNNFLDEAYVQGSGGTYAAAPGRTGILTLSGNF